MPAKFGPKHRSRKSTPALVTCETCGGSFPKTRMHVGPGGVDECTECHRKHSGGRDAYERGILAARMRKEAKRRPEDVELETETAELMRRSREE